jgi:Rrf2 family protein
MRISAKADYAVRAAMGLALVEGPAKAEHIAQRHAIPLKFLEKILFDLRHAGLVATRRGPEGGYWLAKDPAEITVADVLRAVDGPLADVHGLAPEDVEYEEGFAVLQKVWVAVRTSLRIVLESVTIADLAAGSSPPSPTPGPGGSPRRLEAGGRRRLADPDDVADAGAQPRDVEAVQARERAAAVTEGEVHADLLGGFLVEVEDQRFESAGEVLVEHLDGEGHPGTSSSKLGIIDRV